MSDTEWKPMAWWVCDAEDATAGAAWSFQPDSSDLEFMKRATGRPARVIELGDVAAERSRIASLLRQRGAEELARMVEGGE